MDNETIYKLLLTLDIVMTRRIISVTIYQLKIFHKHKKLRPQKCGGREEAGEESEVQGV